MSLPDRSLNAVLLSCSLILLAIIVGCGGQPESYPKFQAHSSSPNIDSVENRHRPEPTAAQAAGPDNANPESSPIRQAAQPRSTTAPATQHYVNLTWKPSSSSIMGYNIYRSSSALGPFTRINLVTEAATVYQDYLVVAGASYYYYVTAVNAQSESIHSNLVAATVPSP